jgi:hypothetical protein
MKLRPQQISKDTFPVPSGPEKNAMKRASARRLRREAKRNPEAAAKKRQYFGWYW